MADEGTKVAAYVPWRTFKNSLDRFSQGLPNRIDKTVFKGQSGSIQTQLLAALKFLGLIGEEDLVPTQAMKALVEKNELERKADLVQIFRASYSKLFDLDLTKATPAQLDGEMVKSYGVSGSTLRKATRFFVVGASDLGIPLSSFLAAAKGGPNGGGAPRRRARRQRPSPDLELGPTPPTPPASGTSKSITLRRGETLILAATADFFAMDPQDRKFVFKLIEELEGYEASAGKGSDVPSGQSQANEAGEE